MSSWLALSFTFALLGLNALFVAAEFALISARRTQLEPAAATGSRAAKLALRAIENVTLAMAAAQLGITLCSLGLGAISEPAVAHLLEPVFELLHVPHSLVHPLSFILALGLVVYAHVVFAEMVPKNLALVAPDRASLILGPFMIAVIWVFRPLVVALNSIANAAVRLFGIEPRDEVASTFTHDEVAGLVEESRREGLLDDEEYGLVSGALDFHQGRVDRVVLPAADLVVLPRRSTAADIERACAETGHSRFPVGETAVEMIGYLHIKDVLETDDETRNEPIADKRVRPLATVTPDAGLYDALRIMQGRGAHMARVARPDGEVLGVIMLEDVLEELVGEIREAGI